MLATALAGSALGRSATATAQPAELSYTVVKSFSGLYAKTAPNPLDWSINSTDGLAWDGSGIWMSSCDTMPFAKLDTNGVLLDEFMLPGMEMADHVAWDGQFLWA